jgi:Lrp/AsnC family transcriptional regulator, regulator for asnA, asnC and gidA
MKNEIFKKILLSKVFMDRIDKQIISVLKKNSRTPFIQIANDLKVSEGTIRNRVKDLISVGEIKKFTIDTENERTAIITAKANTKADLTLLINKIQKIGFEKGSHVSGRMDLVLETNMKRVELNKALDEIRKLKGIEKIETFIILEEE